MGESCSGLGEETTTEIKEQIMEKKKYIEQFYEES
ncbi:hypothetical protein AO9_01335 [Chlamydia psittaci Mat116]|nr:hypothetical protein AO9_01335 [Chlamydia psittaci Mat116]